MPQPKIIAFLLLLFCAAISCKKKQPHPTDHTPKMAGVRHWHGTQRVASSFIDSVTKYIDDTFSIIVVNNKEIFTTISNETLYYSYSDDSTVQFSYEQYAGHGQNSIDEIIYYFSEDKIKFHGQYPYPTSNKADVLDLVTP